MHVILVLFTGCVKYPQSRLLAAVAAGAKTNALTRRAAPIRSVQNGDRIDLEMTKKALDAKFLQAHSPPVDDIRADQGLLLGSFEDQMTPVATAEHPFFSGRRARSRTGAILRSLSFRGRADRAGPRVK